MGDLGARMRIGLTLLPHEKSYSADFTLTHRPHLSILVLRGYFTGIFTIHASPITISPCASIICLPPPPFYAPHFISPPNSSPLLSLPIPSRTRHILRQSRLSRSPATGPCSMPSPISPKEPASTQLSSCFTAFPATRRTSTLRRLSAAMAGTSSTSTTAAPGVHPATFPSHIPSKILSPLSPICVMLPTRRSCAPTPR